jgi:transcriptional regulator with XRE-family HTH domain
LPKSKITLLIKQSGLTRKRICEDVGISMIYLSLIENDERKAVKKREQLIDYLEYEIQSRKTKKRIFKNKKAA